ncbi:hypothetical protein ACP70R_017984 [Stipagrostis hirtigluma subsp. patula]
MASRYMFQRLFSQTSRSTKALVARYFNTLPCSRAAAKINKQPNRHAFSYLQLHQAGICRLYQRSKASFCIRFIHHHGQDFFETSNTQTAAKISRIFSDETGWEAEMAAWEAQIDADWAAFQTERRAKEAA